MGELSADMSIAPIIDSLVEADSRYRGRSVSEVDRELLEGLYSRNLFTPERKRFTVMERLQSQILEECEEYRLKGGALVLTGSAATGGSLVRELFPREPKPDFSDIDWGVLSNESLSDDGYRKVKAIVEANIRKYGEEVGLPDLASCSDHILENL
jgi:predicted nucleotidyltransferase